MPTCFQSLPVQPTSDASGRLPLRTWLVFAICLALAFVVIYARYYGQPGMYSADNLIAEDMYRDLMERGGSWSQWGLSGAAMYLELLVYFAIRAVCGNAHAAMAIHAATMLSLFAGGALYLIWPLLRHNAARQTALWGAPLLILTYAMSSNASLTLSQTLAHALTTAISLWACGLFIRLLDGTPGKWKVVLLSLLTISMSASDRLYVLYFCIPALLFLAFLMYKGCILRKHVLSIGLCLVVSILLGLFLDQQLRAFPPHHNPYSFGPVRALKCLAVLLRYTFLSSNTVYYFLFAGGWLGLALTWKNGGESRRAVSFLVLAALCNLLAIAATGNEEIRYVAMWFAVPEGIGMLLLLVRAGQGLATFSSRAYHLVPYLVALSLIVCAWTSVNAMLPPYSPPLAETLDQLAREKGVKTGIADYWDARPVNLFSKEGVELMPLEWYGYRLTLFNHSRNIMRDRVDMLIENPHSSSYNLLNKDLEFRMNGLPDESIDLPADRKALIYHKGAHHPSEAELMLYGAKLVPEMAAGDRVQWQGKMKLASGLTLTEVRTAPRDGRHVAILFFEEPLHEIQGKEFTLYAAGDKLTKHRRKAAARLSPEVDSFMDKVLLLFIPDRQLRIDGDNSAALPQDETALLPKGSSFAWGKLANWNSKEWLVLLLNDGKRTYRIK